MSLTYDSFVTQLANMAPVSSANAEFLTALPGVIDYAEGRIYRELDLLSVRVTDTSVSCSSGVRSINLSTTQGTLLVVDRLNIFTPVGTTSTDTTRSPVYFTSPDFIDASYPSATSSLTGVPEFAARVNDTQLIFGPAPDEAYGMEVVATIRPNPLSSGNSSTWLTQNLPELFFAGAMVFYTGYQKDFGSQGDSPQSAQSWENQFQMLLKTAAVDSLCAKIQSQGWTPQIPNPIATPQRV